MNSSFPISVKSQYNPNDIVDFLLSFENKSILPNSIRIKGILNITDNNGAATDITTTTNFNFDYIGIHSFFSGFTSSSQKNGVIENWSSEYPRYTRAKYIANNSRQKLSSSSLSAPELKHGAVRSSKFLLANDARNTADKNRVPFSFKPEIAWNKSNIAINHDKTGDIKLSLRLATAAQVFANPNAGNFSYNITELQVEYMSTLKKATGPLQMEVIQMVRNTAESNNTNISTKVPVVARSMTILFRQQGKLDNATEIHTRLEEPPKIERIEYQFNDSTQKYVTYALESREEFLANFQQSLGGDPMNGKHFLPVANEYHMESFFGLGLDFGEYLDLSKNKIGFNMKSSITSNLPYAVFMYFRGLVSL